MTYSSRKSSCLQVISRLVNSGLSKKTSIDFKDNRTSNIVQKKIIQQMKIPWDNMKKATVNSGLLNTGSCSVNIGVNIYAGVAGTFHHIYPKSELVGPLRQIEKVYMYYANKKHNGANDPEVKALNGLRNILITNDSANGYYWNPGTGFGGFAPEYRRDDPGDSPESNKPIGMGSVVFTLAREGRPPALSKLSDSIEKGNLVSSEIEKCVEAEQILKASPFYNTVDEDWTVPEDRKPDFGKKYKIYSIKPSPSL